MRDSNYDDSPNQNFENVETEPFGTDKVKYQSKGGYQGKGGYVFYFSSNLTYEEVKNKYTQMVNDGLYDEYCLSIVVEAMILLNWISYIVLKMDKRDLHKS